MERLVGIFRLTRPANIVTAVSDILAGIAISGYLVGVTYDFAPVLWLILATVGLYGGGVVLNDVFDAELDAVERPERPIPSGVITLGEGARLGVFLLVAGIFCAYVASPLSGIIAFATALAAVIYDKYTKPHPFFGPLNMGICRGLNLLLGLSIINEQIQEYWYLSIVPIIYIAAITMISRGEVHGGRKSTLYSAAALYLVAMASILYVAVSRNEWMATLFFIALWALMVFVPLRNAIRKPAGPMIGRAVKAGVLALILMNAAWASAFGATYLAFVMILLLPLSILLAKAFAVT